MRLQCSIIISVVTISYPNTMWTFSLQPRVGASCEIPTITKNLSIFRNKVQYSSFYNGSSVQYHRILFPTDKTAAQSSIKAATNTSILDEEEEYEDVMDAVEEGDAELLYNARTPYNYIRVIDISRKSDFSVAGARVLLLDEPGNIHSMYYKHKLLTGTYYDVLAMVPPLLPQGTLGILGMGAGTAARLCLDLWPFVSIHGWEIDPQVIWVGREFFGLSELEELHGEKLVVHVGDAFEGVVPGGFSGIFVDLFSKGCLLQDLQRSITWSGLKGKLRDGGRIAVNCGGRSVEGEGPSRYTGHILMQETLVAMSEVFDGELNVLRMGDDGEDVCIALTGPLPDATAWKEMLPSCLAEYADVWEPFVV